jgi:hypothetical protein
VKSSSDLRHEFVQMFRVHRYQGHLPGAHGNPPRGAERESASRNQRSHAGCLHMWLAHARGHYPIIRANAYGTQ